MRKFAYVLTVIAALLVTYNLYNPPRTAMLLLVPSHALERLGYNDGDLSFMLSADSGCKHKFSKHNYTVMFRHEGNWRDVKVWTQHVTLYPTWQEIWQIKDEIHLCIRFKDQWASVWKGKFSLKGTFNLYVAHKNFFCNKENITSEWECSSYETYHSKKDEIYKLLIKYAP